MKTWAKRKVYRFSLPLLCSLAHQKNAVIGLSYHRFERYRGEDKNPGMAITPEALDAQLAALQKHARFISLDQWLQQDDLQTGISILLSFDDGYLDNAQTLLPILEKYQAPCTIYLVSDYVLGRMSVLEHDKKWQMKPVALSPRDLQELKHHPLITLGLHTQTHPILSHISSKQVEQELGKSKVELEQALAISMDHFAVPSGKKKDFNQSQLEKVLNQLGYKTYATNYGGINQLPIKGLNEIKRVPMTTTADPYIALGWALGWQRLKG